jgi:hypothetical protein
VSALPGGVVVGEPTPLVFVAAVSDSCSAVVFMMEVPSGDRVLCP